MQPNPLQKDPAHDSNDSGEPADSGAFQEKDIGEVHTGGTDPEATIGAGQGSSNGG